LDQTLLANRLLNNWRRPTVWPLRRLARATNEWRNRRSAYGKRLTKGLSSFRLLDKGLLLPRPKPELGQRLLANRLLNSWRRPTVWPLRRLARAINEWRNRPSAYGKRLTKGRNNFRLLGVVRWMLHKMLSGVRQAFLTPFNNV
jgi:hypothetical protein